MDFLIQQSGVQHNDRCNPEGKKTLTADVGGNGREENGSVKHDGGLQRCGSLCSSDRPEEIIFQTGVEKDGWLDAFVRIQEALAHLIMPLLIITSPFPLRAFAHWSQRRPQHRGMI